jgi:sugar diacid utilization regulator
MTAQLTAEQRPQDTVVDGGDAALAHVLSASGAMRRSDDPDHILDILVSTVLLVAPVSSVWAGWKSAGAPLRHATLFDPIVEAGPRGDPATRLEAALEAWTPRLAPGRPPFEVDIGDTPLADAGGQPETLSVFPVSSADRLGALVVRAPLARLSTHRALIGLLCERALTALELVSTRAAGRRAEALFETLTQLTASHSDAELVLQTIVRSTAELLDSDAAYVMLVDDEGKTLRVRTAYGITASSFYEPSYPVDGLLPGAAIRKRRVMCVRDLQSHEEAKNSRSEGLRTTMCAPMFVEDRLVGVLMAAHREIREQTPEDRRLMGALANAAAVSIGNASLYAEREDSLARLAEVNRLLEERSAAGERTMAFQQRLTTLVLEAGGLEEIVGAMTATLGCRVVILDRELAVLHASPGAEVDHDALSGAVSSLEGAFGIARITAGADELLIAPLDFAGARSAYVVVIADGNRLEGTNLGMTEAAVTAIGLELMRDRASVEAEARLTGGLFQALLTGDEVDEAAIIRRASYLGYDLSGANAVIAVIADDSSCGRRPLNLETCIQRAIRRHRDGPIAVFEREEAIFVVLSDPDDVPVSLIEEHTALIKQELEVSGRSSGVRIAFSEPHQGVAGVRRAVDEATYALHVLSVLGRNGKPQAFGDLGVWTLLGRVGDADHLRSFADSVLGVLMAHDAERQSQLIDTVRTLVECNFHYRTAAEVLFTHPNTLRYRMARITELTRLDFADADDRLKVELALRILDVIGPGGG